MRLGLELVADHVVAFSGLAQAATWVLSGPRYAEEECRQLHDAIEYFGESGKLLSVVLSVQALGGRGKRRLGGWMRRSPRKQG